MTFIQKSAFDSKDLVETNLHVTNGHPDDRRDTALRNQQAVENHVEELTRQKDAASKEWAHETARYTGQVPEGQPVQSSADAKDARSYRWQAWGLFPVEVWVGGYVAMVTVTSQLATWQRFLIGAALAVLIAILFRGWVKAVLFKREIPGLSREALKKRVNILTMAVVGAVAVLMALRFGRFGREPLLIVSTTVTSLALPFLSAVYFQLSDSYRALNDLAHTYDRLDQELSFAKRVLRNIQAVLAGSSVSSTTPEPVAAPTSEEVLQ